MGVNRFFVIIVCVLQYQTSFSQSSPLSRVALSLIRDAAFNYGENGIERIIAKKIDAHQSQQRRRNMEHRPKTGHLNHEDPLGPHPEVRIQSGLIIGETIENSHAFYSVPYGKAPIGSLRFMPPEPAEDFGELNASLPNYRMCWQIKDCDDDDPGCRDPMSEDCLVLNVNVPAHVDLSDSTTPPNDRLPVLVWMHGGFFFRGRATTTKYDGRWLSDAIDAVVVTANYRIGPLGFLSFQDDIGYVEGNQGIKDQQLALKWVQENILSFGGDKDRVTLFGDSAGSQAINFHLVSPVSDPLFHRAITESSPAVFRYQTSEESMLAVTERVLGAIGCEGNASCLRSVDPETLTYTRDEVMAELLLSGDLFGAIEPFRPVIDGNEFTEQPLTLFKNGNWQTHKEVMIGTNEEEMAYVSAFFTSIGLPLPKTLFEKINTIVLGATDGTTINSLYEERLDADLSDNFASELTDLVFICPNRAFARYAASTSTHPEKRVYLFNNGYALSVENCLPLNDLDEVCGHSYHSSEQIFVFKSAAGFETNFTAEDSHVSDMFSTYWGSFANNGDPSSGLTVSLGDFTEWPIYSPSSSPPWQNIRLDNPQGTVQNDFRGKYCDAWEKIGYKQAFSDI